jgi:hypothetical protein
MKPPSERRTAAILWAAAIAALGIGAAMAATGFATLRERHARLIEKRAEMNELRAIEREGASAIAALAALERLPEKQAARLDGASGGAIKPDDARDTRHELGGGWIVRRREWAYNDAPLRDVLAMAREGERTGFGPNGVMARPPWRLSSLVFRATPGSPGRGRIVMRLDAVERP